MSDTEQIEDDLTEAEEQISLERMVALVDLALDRGGVVGDYQRNEPARAGDPLALFLARELIDVYEPDADRATNLHLAANAVREAMHELERVLYALESA